MYVSSLTLESCKRVSAWPAFSKVRLVVDEIVGRASLDSGLTAELSTALGLGFVVAIAGGGG